MELILNYKLKMITMKFKYLTILTFATAMVSCDVLDKEPADSWESSSAITSYEDLVYAVNGVYESQTWTSATSSRGIYSGILHYTPI